MAAGTILVVDHEVAFATEMEGKLRRLGYTVAGVASSPVEAAASMNLARPDVVLMNVALEGDPDVLAAAGAIRSRWPAPIVFLTPDANEVTLRRAGVIEPFGYVVKPYADRELRMNVEMALYREAMNRQAHELEDRFFAVSIDLLCFLDFSGYFKRLNPAWERTLGFTRAELMSRPFIEFVHPEDRERTLHQNRTVRRGGHAHSFENRYVCKDGSYRWLLWNAAPDADHRVIYSVARDVTERKQADQERETMLRELQEALAEVRTLQEILPICSYCKKIRDDDNYWQTVEGYIAKHTNARFSHSICPSCYTREVEPQFDGLDSK